jgi:hypothetical protein
MATENSLQSRILKSFDRYLQPSEVVMHSGGATVTLPGSVILKALRHTRPQAR